MPWEATDVSVARILCILPSRSLEMVWNRQRQPRDFKDEASLVPACRELMNPLRST